MNLAKLILTIFLVTLSHSFCRSQSFTISGRITSSETGETITGVYIGFEGYLNTTVSNEYGFYSCKVKPGKLVLLSSHLGFKSFKEEITVFSDTTLDIELIPIIFEIDDVVISANTHNYIRSNQMSSINLTINKIKEFPQIAGETDIIKTLTFLPGVTTANEGTNSISVRGGSFGQNLIILDEAIIMNPNHALSLFSTFNPDAISSVELYSSAFPAKYGGRLSSVIDVRMKEGNRKKTSVSGGIGLLSSRLTIEGPIINEKSSFLISGRYCYAGFLANQMANLNSLSSAFKKFRKGNEINFFDINGKINTIVNEKNHLFISGYFGNDHFYFKNFSDNFSLDWGNQTTTVRWNHIFTSKLFSNSTFTYSDYYYDYTLKNDTRSFLWHADMSNIQLKTDFEHFINNKLRIDYGLFSTLTSSLPGMVKPKDSLSVIIAHSLIQRNSFEIGGYSEMIYKVIDPLSMRMGIRVNSFSEIGERIIYYNDPVTNSIIDTITYLNGQNIKTFNNLEPRFLLNYLVSSLTSIKVSFSKTTQYYHLLSNSNIGMPTDIWIPSGIKISPQHSKHYNIGFYHDFNKIETSIEFYYKRMNNIIDFKDNANLFLNDNIESQLLIGSANAYGIELFLKKDYGRAKGWVSYSLSKVNNHIDGINNDRPYSPAYDKPHNIRIMAVFELTKKWSISSAFAFSSGSRLTIPTGTFKYYGASFNYYSQRNAYRVPAFHQLDISISYKTDTKKKLHSEFLFSISNIYNRKNVFMIYSRPDDNNLDQSKTFKLYLHGIFPSITYNYKF